MTVVQNSNPAPRPRGRPRLRCDEDTLQLVIDAAAKAFESNGYAATCMGDIAQSAGISTKTLYRLVPAKQDLFTLVITTRTDGFMLALDQNLLGSLDLTESLERLLIAYGTLALASDTTEMLRLVLAERERFPELATSFYQRALMRTSGAMVEWLKHQSQKGLIEIEDAQTAADMLRGMLIVEVQRAMMLGQRAAPDAPEIEKRAKACARIFLKGCEKQYQSA